MIPFREQLFWISIYSQNVNFFTGFELKVSILQTIAIFTPTSTRFADIQKSSSQMLNYEKSKN